MNAFRITCRGRAHFDHLTTSQARQYGPHMHITYSLTRPMAPNYTSWKPYTCINTGNRTDYRLFHGNTDRRRL